MLCYKQSLPPARLRVSYFKVEFGWQRKQYLEEDEIMYQIAFQYWIGLSIGSFIFEALTYKDWNSAIKFILAYAIALAGFCFLISTRNFS